jgi:hypothetical protein
MTPQRSVARPRRAPAALAFAGLLGLLVFAPGDAHAGSALSARSEARGLRVKDGYEAARALARGWQGDASLVYVEAADSLWSDGSANAWTYLYWSPQARITRGWKVRIGGGVTTFDLAFPFAPPALEDGWLDAMQALAGAAKDPGFRRAYAAGSLRVAMLSNGLTLRSGPSRTTWLFGFGDGADPGREWIGDALRGSPITEREGEVPEASGELAGGRARLTPWLAAHGAAALVRAGGAQGAVTRESGERPRWLNAREAAALAQLAGTDAALDSLGQGAVEAAGADVEASLAALAHWRDANAGADSLLARSAARIAAARADLAAERPTEVALYLALDARARPASIRVSIDGTEVARATYADAEWRALDAGAWAEITRRTARPGAREVRVDVEGADRRTQTVTWKGSLPAGQLTLLRLKLGGGESKAAALDFVAATAP